MTSSLTKIIDSKRALRREIGARSVAEKLKMLDALLARTSSLTGTKRKRATQT